MQQPTNTPNRKKILWWGAAVLASFTALKFFGRNKKEPQRPVVKMLTEDGRLVEVNKDVLIGGNKITNEELQQWVKK